MYKYGMTEPRRSTRDHLLATGTRLARSAGLRELTVRGVCEAAGANTGSFVYHFGTRDAFVAELIERWYAPLMSGLTATVDSGGAPVARLRALVLQLAGWAAANSRFITTLVLDAAAGEAAAQRFLRSLAGRHPPLILRVLREGQKAGELRAADPLHRAVRPRASGVRGRAAGFPCLRAARSDSPRPRDVRSALTPPAGGNSLSHRGRE